MTNQASAKYDVGYCKPPREHQFKKGVSGNPMGRKKKKIPPVPSFGELVQRIALEMIPATINGKRTEITNLEAAVRRALADYHAKGDIRGLKMLLPHLSANLEKSSSVYIPDWDAVAKMDVHQKAEAYRRMLGHPPRGSQS